jgi:ankyrin repeat protein
MNIKRFVGVCCAVVMLSGAGLAAGSEVADAAMNQNKAAVRSLIDQRADVNAPQADGATALHWAVRWDDLEMVDLLLKSGANPKSSNRNGATPLFLASENGSAQVLERLLDAGVDPNVAVLPNGETALMLAARSGHLDAVKALVDHGANVNTAENLDGTTALMWAAFENHPAVIDFLFQRGADVNARSKVVAPPARRGGNPNNDAEDAPPPTNTKGGLSALIIAAREGHVESVRALIAAGTAVNQRSGDQTSPLLAAVQNGFYDVAALLLDNNADPNLANAKGWTPLYMVVKNRNIETGTVPLPNDIGELEFIELILDRGADPNLQIKGDTEVHSGFKAVWLEEEGATPFFRAAIAGDMAVLKILMAHGADPSIRTSRGATPLMAAAGVGWTDGFSKEYSEAQTVEVMRMLIDMGADVNAADERRITALHGAAHKAATGAIKLLVENGAKLDAKDNGKVASFGNTAAGGLSPLDWAMGVPIGASSGIFHPEAVELLTNYMTEQGIPITTSQRTLGGNAGAKKQD